MSISGLLYGLLVKYKWSLWGWDTFVPTGGAEAGICRPEWVKSHASPLADYTLGGCDLSCKVHWVVNKTRKGLYTIVRLPFTKYLSFPEMLLQSATSCGSEYRTYCITFNTFRQTTFIVTVWQLVLRYELKNRISVNRYYRCGSKGMLWLQNSTRLKVGGHRWCCHHFEVCSISNSNSCISKIPCCLFASVT